MKSKKQVALIIEDLEINAKAKVYDTQLYIHTEGYLKALEDIKEKLED